MSGFWRGSGWHLLDRRDDGRHRVTPDFLRAYLFRPELRPVEESCPAERALHAALLDAPDRPLTPVALLRLRDPDVRENYEVYARWRALLLRAPTLEDAYLELAMGDGHAVVRYDCMSFRVLKDCRAEGSYAYAPVTPKEDVVKLASRDEVAANLPVLGAKLSAGLERGKSIDIALVTVGKRRSTRQEAIVTDLHGNCGGATHVVRGAYIGAFAMTSGSVGKVQASAEVFGAAYLSPHMRDLYVFVILIAVLLFRPSGLFGKAVVEKV